MSKMSLEALHDVTAHRLWMPCIHRKILAAASVLAHFLRNNTGTHFRVSGPWSYGISPSNDVEGEMLPYVTLS